MFLYGLVVRKPFTKVHQSLHFLAMLGKVDIKVGGTGKCQKKVTDVGQTTQPRRPSYCIRMIVLENFVNLMKRLITSKFFLHNIIYASLLCTF